MTLGIALRQHEIPTEIWESGTYPRHRVCGEFINGRGQDVLRRIGLAPALFQAGATVARTAAFHSESASLSAQLLPQSAWCLSRYVLDHLLARDFVRRGGVLCENQRWRGTFNGDGIIRATGRQPQPPEVGWRWFGMKVHARQVDLVSDLEMHVRQDGYVGLCRLADQKVNICGVFRLRAPIHDFANCWPNLIRGNSGSPLFRQLESAEFDLSSVCGVAGLGFRPLQISNAEECALGDALGMIAPLTGNGMSMAFESAALALEPLIRFSRSEWTWEVARRCIHQHLESSFRPRQAWAWRLQRAIMHPFARNLLVFPMKVFPPLWRWWFRRTR